MTIMMIFLKNTIIKALLLKRIIYKVVYPKMNSTLLSLFFEVMKQ